MCATSKGACASGCEVTGRARQPVSWPQDTNGTADSAPGPSVTVTPRLVGDLTLAVVDQVVPAPVGPAWPDRDSVVVLAGAGEAEQQRLRQFYPDALVLELDRDAGIERIAQRLEHVTAAASGRSDRARDLERAGGDRANARRRRPDRCPERGSAGGLSPDQGFAEAGLWDPPLGLTVLTHQALALHRSETIGPAHASVHGLIGSLAKEYAHWQVRLVDLPEEKRDESEVEWPLQELLALPAQPAGDPVAYRLGQWHRPAIDGVRAACAGRIALSSRRGVLDRGRSGRSW